MDQHSKASAVQQTADIVAAYVANNSVTVAALPELIGSVHDALVNLGRPLAGPEPASRPPAVSIRKSLASRDRIISMIDGKPYATLKRHLTTQGLTPDEYRARFNLPRDYPMVAPAYSERRSAMAKELGLGRKVGKAAGGDAPAKAAPKPRRKPKA